MAIDLLSEHVVSLTEATQFLPRRRRGRKPHCATLYRWTTHGCKGIVLESLQVGGTRCTSKEALARFFAALTNANLPRAQQPPTSRHRGAAAVERELERQGI